METAVGVPLPVKPKEVVAFAARVPFQLTFLAVTVVPLVV